MTAAPIVVEAPAVVGPGVVALVRLDPGKVHALHFHLGDDGAPPPPSMDAFVCATLLVAMTTGRPLALEAPVSGVLLDALPELQRRFTEFFPGRFRAVPVHAERRADDPVAPPRPEAAFFSAGVDSMHLALQARERLDALVFVGSFHTPTGLPVAIDHIRGGVRAAADHLGLPLVELSSNIRQFLELFCNWELCHGAALGAAAHALSGRFAVVRAGSTNDPDDASAWGSHADLDPLWSGTDVALRYEGGEWSRTEKIAEIVRHPELVPYLQVCWQHHRSAYNCGSCEKCTRLAIELAWHGTATPTLPSPSPLAWMRAPADDHDLRSFRSAARAKGDRTALAAAEARVRGRALRSATGRAVRAWGLRR